LAIACSTSDLLAKATLACTSPVLGFEHVAAPSGAARHCLAADEMADLAHGLFSLGAALAWRAR
jgi:hypothetical protein